MVPVAVIDRFTCITYAGVTSCTLFCLLQHMPHTEMNAKAAISFSCSVRWCLSKRIGNTLLTL